MVVLGFLTECQSKGTATAEGVPGTQQKLAKPWKSYSIASTATSNLPDRRKELRLTVDG